MQGAARARRIAALAGLMLAAERGSVLIFVAIMLLIMGFFLFGFQALNLNEVFFAAFSRNSALAFDVAEAGAQEAINRLNMFGATPGATCFVNSLESAATCSGSTSSPNANTVVYEATLANDPAVFPILSLADVNGAARAVRVLVQTTYKTGFSNIIFGSNIFFQGDSSPITGDTYSTSTIKFQTYGKSPQPATGATATNLVSPQVMAGADITTQGAGPGDFTSECSSGSVTEVAPTNCARGRNPINWHPATPIGMPAADFNQVITTWNGNSANLPAGVSVVQATQNGTGVRYSPVGYTPPYWSEVGGTNGKVLLVVATQPFCVNPSAHSVTAAPCGTGVDDYGRSGATMRFVDWGLVADDQSRPTATTFYQAPTCNTCNNGGPNGLRYIPFMPSINVLSLACQANEPSPGFSAFYNVTADGLTCPNPPTRAGSSTFTGTESNPEFLVIDNGPPGGTVVSLSSSGSASGCADNFANANWGVILATGDLDIHNLGAFNGYIYTPGNVTSHGHNILRGAVFQQSNNSSIHTLGTTQFCGGASVEPITPTFSTFSGISWQDRPLAQP